MRGEIGIENCSVSCVIWPSSPTNFDQTSSGFRPQAESVPFEIWVTSLQCEAWQGRKIISASRISFPSFLSYLDELTVVLAQTSAMLIIKFVSPAAMRGDTGRKISFALKSKVFFVTARFTPNFTGYGARGRSAICDIRVTTQQLGAT